MSRRKPSPVTAISESSLFDGTHQIETPSPKAPDFPLSAVAAQPLSPALPPVLAPRLAQPLTQPHGISKSMAKAIACPTFFTGQYLQPERLAANEHFLARTGQEFHAWRKAYVDHLVASNRWSDDVFRDAYLAEHALSEDARTLIGRDRFEVDPDSVFATELFLSIDQDFEPLELATEQQPGRLSADPRFLLSGTLDLLLLEGRTAIVLDPKSGFSTTGVTDDEPAFYAALVFAHFPLVEEVQFRWDFVRMSALRRTSYTRRDDLEWIHDRIRVVNAQKDLTVERYNLGLALDANPFSGLCPSCQLACPLRPRWEAGELSLAMPQTKSDAVRLAQLVKVCEDVIGSAKQLLLKWLDQEPDRELTLGLGFAASVRVDDKHEYPLIDALRSLGLDVVDIQALDGPTRQLIEEQRPAYTPAFDVPLASLHLGGLSSFCKTKKSMRRKDGGGGISRETMKAELALCAKRSASTTVVIRKQSQQGAAERLEATLEA